MDTIRIFKISDVFIVKKSKGSDFFYTTSDSFGITVFNFSALLNYMLSRGLLSPKVLEGVLSEYYNEES